MPTIDSTVEKYQRCIELCNSYMKACEECVNSCLKEPDVAARIKCVQMLRDCADICSLASQFMARNSAFAKQICSLCADICEACARECEMFKDAHCQQCADICRRCAQECRYMANM
ncbi:uncharacterized protein DUF326 [Thermosediminibacter litoriperuensis]|uniref:Uncharacterized protein DUF326 n=2 Tax=Thermosediminibacter litoriperuensis TaxID=291989 RepID=A0A5S5AWA5_9FIRM|nr:uncharacterized protein DUF326 [Thermosediminibacter litoriperuensis]